MSNDDSQEKKPLKLKLSRDVNKEGSSDDTEEKVQQSNTPADKETEQPLCNASNTRPPIIPHREPEATNPETEQSSEQNDEHPKLSLPTQNETVTPEPASPEPEPEATQLEDTIQSVDTQKAGSAEESSLLPSIIVLLVLFIILGGAGYGLWRVLQEPEAGQPVEQSASAEPEAVVSKNPIERAKETIAQVPVANVDDLQVTEPETPEMPVSREESVEEKIGSAEELSQKEAAALDANKQQISEFLSGIRIDGVRKGDRPKVMIKGKSYLAGDTVDIATGLKFFGIRDGRLAFQDKNGILYLKSF